MAGVRPDIAGTSVEQGTDRASRVRAAVNALQARIGEPLEAARTVVVEEPTVGRFLRAVGSPNARTAKSVPLAFLAHVGFEPASVLRDARPDETLGGSLIDPLNGGTAIIRHREVPLGTTLTRTVTLKQASVREARSGPLAAVVVAITISDDAGAIGTAERTMLYRDARA